MGHRQWSPLRILRKSRVRRVTITVAARELRTWLFAAIGSHPHIVATRAAPVEMTLAMPAKRSENQTVLAPALWALLANANLVFRAGESRFGHGNDGTIPSSTVAACTLIGAGVGALQGNFLESFLRVTRVAMHPQPQQAAPRSPPRNSSERITSSLPAYAGRTESGGRVHRAAARRCIACCSWRQGNRDPRHPRPGIHRASARRVSSSVVPRCIPDAAFR